MFKTIKVDRGDLGVTTITLNRPEVHNAFDKVMIAELDRSLQTLDEDADTRIVLFRASGKSFSAGADIGWMKRAADLTEQENYDDAMAFAGLLKTLDTLSKPTLAFVHGPTYGGGVGLISCCDIVVALEKTVFSLSEVKLGLVPAVISPYVVRAIGARAARRYFQSAERFNSREAHRIGLVHEIADSDSALSEIIDALLDGGPQAQAIGKKMIVKVDRPTTEALIEDTARTIAKVRVSEEGQEGLKAFFEKRKSSWSKQR